MTQSDQQKRAFAVVGMFCLLLLISLTGCKSKDVDGLNTGRIEATRTAIKENIHEPDRQNKIIELVDSFEAETRGVIDEILELRQQIIVANQSYETTREDLKQLYAQTGTKLHDLGKLTREKSLEMRTLCSEAEWNQIASHDDKLVSFTF